MNQRNPEVDACCVETALALAADLRGEPLRTYQWKRWPLQPGVHAFSTQEAKIERGVVCSKEARTVEKIPQRPPDLEERRPSRVSAARMLCALAKRKLPFGGRIKLLYRSTISPATTRTTLTAHALSGPCVRRLEIEGGEGWRVLHGDQRRARGNSIQERSK